MERQVGTRVVMANGLGGCCDRCLSGRDDRHDQATEKLFDARLVVIDVKAGAQAVVPKIRDDADRIQALMSSKMSAYGIQYRSSLRPPTTPPRPLVGIPAEHDRFAFISRGTWSMVGWSCGHRS
jgi:hypothetical protein